jgi:hypothetical protein
MRVIAPTTEDAMVLAFLRAEIDSSRFAGLAALADLGLDRTLVDQADVSDPEANLRRRQVLLTWRGARRGAAAGVFSGFPDDVAWSWVALTPEELADVLYIHWDYWLDVSGGTRRPGDAIARMRAQWDVPGDDVHEIADALARGSLPPEIIVVGLPPARGLVVLEGHVRLSGLLLRPERLPSEVRVLLGTSLRIAEWACYGPA